MRCAIDSLDMKQNCFVMFPVLSFLHLNACGLEQFPYENPRVEHFFHFKMFLKKWCPKHSWNNFHIKTHVFEHFFYFKMFWKKWCSKHPWKNFHMKTHDWTLFPFQDVLKEVMFQTLLEQFPYEKPRFEHFFHFKMFWKKWCSKYCW